jgi:putative peptide zinc metalloprotease protein
MDKNKENAGTTPPKPYWLRKLRRGVTLRFNGYDHDGIPQWLLYDSGRNKFFVVGWPEYEMLSRWHLANPHLIINAVNKETTLTVDKEDFENLENFLNKNYLVEQRWRSVYQKAREQKVIKGENVFYWFVRYYLFFRIPLFHPDNFLTKTKKFGQFLFKPSTSYFMLFLGLVAIYQISRQWEEFTHTFSTIFTWQGLIFYFFAFTIAKFFHEFGHAYMSKIYGVTVPTMGVAFLVFWPVLYTDTTQSWSLPSHQRMRIALAGMWVETYLTIFAALIWCNVHNTTIQMICYVTVAINWVSTLLINVSPFMRFDGYYVLSDLLKMPNLQNRSFALARWQIRNWLFGWEEPQQEVFSNRMHWILVSYAIITWIYRLFIYIAIAILVYHYFFKVVGIILFIIELFAFILRPLVQEIQTWYELRNQFTLNKRTIITTLCATILVLLLFLPLNQSLRMNATLSYAHDFLYATQDAIIQSALPIIGTPVKKDDIIVELKSPELEYNLQKVKLEYQKIVTEIRRASLLPKFSNQLGSLEAELAAKKAQYNKLLDLNNKLTIRAPYDGVITDISPELKTGNAVSKNTLIANIINPKVLVVEAYVEQVDIDILTLDAKGYFYPSNLDEPYVPVKVQAIEPINTGQLASNFSKKTREGEKRSVPVDTPSYHSSDLGGKIATNQTDKGAYVPVDSVYRVLLTPTPENPVNLSQIEVGTVILTVGERSIAYRISYHLKRIFVQESGF